MTDTSVQVFEDLGIDLESLLGETPPEDCAHIVRRVGGMSAQQVINNAVRTGTTVRALCGYEWMPTGLAPDDLTACQPCVNEWQRITGSGA